MRPAGLNLGHAWVLALALGLICLACDGSGAGGAGGRGAAQVVGTTLDGSTGDVLVGVLVEGPDGQRAVSNLAGRFELSGLNTGDSGHFKASRGEHYHGALDLGPLQAGSLEVVFHLTPRRE
jgi:hypothetical protein